jgi:hypothetical protein
LVSLHCSGKIRAGWSGSDDGKVWFGGEVIREEATE